MERNGINMKKLIYIILFIAVAFSQKINEKAPLFKMTSTNGDAIDLSSYKGKVILIDFWASWCGPCRKEFPFLIELKEKYGKDGFEIIAINIDTKEKNMNRFILKQKNDVNFPIIWDPKSELAKIYKPETMPTTFILDKNGIIKAKHNGFKNSSKDEYESLINELLGSTK